MRRRIAFAFLFTASLQAGSALAAGWEIANGTAFARVGETNSTIIALAVQCNGEMNLELYATDDGPVLNAVSGATNDFHYQPGKVQAAIDGVVFPLAAAGSEWSTVLFSQGTEGENYLAPLTAPFVNALRNGRELELRFDLLPDHANDGSPFETTARFPLGGAAAAMDTTGDACR